MPEGALTSPTRWLRPLYTPQLCRGIYMTLRSLVGETSVPQGAGPSSPAGGVTGPFGPRFRVSQEGSVWQCLWFSWSHTVTTPLCKVKKNELKQALCTIQYFRGSQLTEWERRFRILTSLAFSFNEESEARVDSMPLSSRRSLGLLNTPLL